MLGSSWSCIFAEDDQDAPPLQTREAGFQGILADGVVDDPYSRAAGQGLGPSGHVLVAILDDVGSVGT